MVALTRGRGDDSFPSRLSNPVREEEGVTSADEQDVDRPKPRQPLLAGKARQCGELQHADRRPADLDHRMGRMAADRPPHLRVVHRMPVIAVGTYVGLDGGFPISSTSASRMLPFCIPADATGALKRSAPGGTRSPFPFRTHIGRAAKSPEFPPSWSYLNEPG